MPHPPASARKTTPSGGFGEPVRPHYADAADVTLRLAPDKPVHLFAPAVLRASLNTFGDGFPGAVSYAVKANDGAHILATLADSGLGCFDVASLEEIVAVRAAAPLARLHYHNPVKGRNEIAAAAQNFGVVRFAADDRQEIDKIVAAAGEPSRLEIAVRFRLPRHSASAHDFSGKFGAEPALAQQLLRHVADLGCRPFLTFHPGSQCSDPAIWTTHIQAAAGIARGAGVRLSGLNVGGGFPSRYLGLQAPELSVYFSTIAQAAREAFGADFAPALECEPGRALVAGCTSVLARVKLVKADRHEVFLNDGIYGSLMEVSQAPVLQPFYRTLRAGEVLAGANVAHTVYGPTCDPLDVLPNRLDLAAGIGEGDYVEFGPLGAYGTATSTRFNGYDAAEIIGVEQVLKA